MDVKNLFYLSYWFSQPFSAEGRIFWAWIIIFLVFILAGIITLFVRHFQVEKFNRQILQKYATGGIVFGLLGLLWFFFRQERVLLFSLRFWILVWFGAFIFWLVRLCLFVMRRLPAIRIEQAERARKKQYLPSRK